MRNTWYFAVSRPMLIFRVPFPMPRWKDILKAMTPVMHEYGYRQKDINFAELLHLPDGGEWTADDDQFADRLDQAFLKGSTILPDFDLFDWKRGRFVPVRQAFE